METEFCFRTTSATLIMLMGIVHNNIYREKKIQQVATSLTNMGGFCDNLALFGQNLTLTLSFK